MIRPLAAALLILSSTAAKAGTVDASQFRVVDGDTVELAGKRIRLIEPDAPEIAKPRCNSELAKGLLASGRLRQLLTGPVTLERSGRTDKFGRTLASLTVPKGNVADILITEGLALRYRPGFEAHQQRAQHWCPPL